MNYIAIVAVGYNRPDSMATLLNSIGRIKTDSDIDLVISIDKGKCQKEIIDVADNFSWPYGEKIVRAFKERQGLRSHIINCGDLTEKYEAVIILEDDLIVSPHCISYVKQAIEFYKEDDRIGGISLYKHLFHPGKARPFEAANNGYDAFLMQFAQSWGQCWTRKMWQGFKAWYVKNENMNLSDGGILPNYIATWNEHSWLKYYMRYIVETDKYYVYPSVALSSNSSDAGQHCSALNNDYQVPLQSGLMHYRFPQVEEAIKYDAFFERIGIEDGILGDLKGRKKLDLYGCRTEFSNIDYLISTQTLPYNVKKEIALRYRPIEQNIFDSPNGLGIYVYDMSKVTKKPHDNQNTLTRYDVRGIHWKRLIKLGFVELKDAIVRRIMSRGLIK